jgi:hypothetical protein
VTREDEHRVSEAKRLLSEPLFNEILADFEKSEIDRVVSASGEDADRVRREAADSIRVIRNFKSRLETYALQATQSNRPRSNA